jgi:hypothetical protein
MSKYLVIETWPSLDQAAIVVDPDSGTNLIFDTEAAAQSEADQCQAGIVVPVI